MLKKTGRTRVNPVDLRNFSWNKVAQVLRSDPPNSRWNATSPPAQREPRPAPRHTGAAPLVDLSATAMGPWRLAGQHLVAAGTKLFGPTPDSMTSRWQREAPSNR